MVTKFKFILFTLVFFMASRSLTIAQAEADVNIAPAANSFCSTEDCKLKDSSLPQQMPDFWKPVPDTQADQSGDRANPDFYYKNNPATERGSQHGSFSGIEETLVAQRSIPEKPIENSGRLSTQYDPFRNENRSFGRKYLRASVLTQGIQAVNLAVMLALPDSATFFSCHSWSDARNNLRHAWTSPPVWDKDAWPTNYLIHPYGGSIYYNAFRSQGASARASFFYSISQSLVWEYVIEAVAEPPSRQDLIFTPTVGSVLGEVIHRATIRMGRNGFSTVEKIVTSIINPAYVYNNGFKKRHRNPPPIF